ncbi:putative ribonuclease H-like domain-containing protein [Tanacetum coccineum]
MNVSSNPITRINKDHPIELIIGDLHSAPLTRRMSQQNLEEHCLEPKKVIQALEDPSWIEAMQDELLQFKLHKVWTLVDLPNGKRAIGTKWVFRNKKDKRGIVIRNKARLVAQDDAQEIPDEFYGEARLLLRFQVTPKTSHLHDVKRIFRYLKGQPKLGRWYPRDSPFNLEAFSNSDYAGVSLDRKSTTGGVDPTP